jgi:hypothetical protein
MFSYVADEKRILQVYETSEAVAMFFFFPFCFFRMILLTILIILELNFEWNLCLTSQVCNNNWSHSLVQKR